MACLAVAALNSPTNINIFDLGLHYLHSALVLKPLILTFDAMLSDAASSHACSRTDDEYAGPSE